MYMEKLKISDDIIIKSFFRSSHSIKKIAGVLGLPKSYVGTVIIKYKKKHQLR